MDSNVEARRELAIERLKAKHDFKIHLAIYFAVNALLVAIWALSDWSHPQGFFWPIFVILGWGIGVVAHWYTVYRATGYSEDQIQREMKNLP